MLDVLQRPKSSLNYRGRRRIRSVGRLFCLGLAPLAVLWRCGCGSCRTAVTLDVFVYGGRRFRGARWQHSALQWCSVRSNFMAWNRQCVPVSWRLGWGVYFGCGAMFRDLDLGLCLGIYMGKMLWNVGGGREPAIKYDIDGADVTMLRRSWIFGEGWNAQVVSK